MKSNTIIISIHPCHIDKIFSRVKLYEYRKKIPIDIKHIIVYATAPVKKIVAIIEVDSIMKETPKEIWNKTKDASGLTKKFFMSYFYNKKTAYAIKFSEVYILTDPKPLSILNNIRFAPQSYIYAKEPLSEIEKKLGLHI